MSMESPVIPPPALDPLIQARLREFVARRRGLILRRGLLGALAAWLGTVICVAAADLLFLLEDGTRLAFSLGAYALAAAAFWRLAGRPLRERADLGAAARWLEASDPKLREWVLAAVELGQANPVVHDSIAFRGLVQQQVARELSSRDVRQLLPAALVMRWVKVAALALLLVAALFCVPGLPTARLLARAAWPGANLDRVSRTRLDVVEPAPAEPTVPRGGVLPVVVQVGGRPADELTLERFADGEERVRVRMKPIGDGRFSAALDADRPQVQYRIRGGDALTRRFTVTTVPAPRVVAFRKAYRYPDYTQLPAKSVSESGGVLDGVEGTEVDLTLETDQPVTEAALRLDYGERKDTRSLAAKGASAVGGTLRLDRSGTYHVKLVAHATGFENTQSPVYEIRVTPDLVPAVELETPTADRAVAPDEVVALAGRARDDFGVAVLKQEYQVNRQGWKVAQEWPSTQQEARASTSWDLLALGLKPGDELLVRYTAQDRRGSRGESTTRRLVVGPSGAQAGARAAVAAQQRVVAALEQAAKAGQELRKTHEAQRDALRRGREEPAIRTAQAQVAEAVRELDQAAQAAEQAVQKALEQASAGTASRELAAVGRTLSRLRRNELAMAEARIPMLEKQDRPEAERNAESLQHAVNRAQWEPQRTLDAMEKMLAADESALAAHDAAQLAGEMQQAQELARAEDPARRAAGERRQAASATQADALADQLDELASRGQRKGDLQRMARELREAAEKSQAALEKPAGEQTKSEAREATENLRRRTAQARDELRPMAAQLGREAEEARRKLERELDQRPLNALEQALGTLAWQRELTPAQRERQAALAEVARRGVADQLRDQAALEERRSDGSPTAPRELSDLAAAVEQVRPDAADPKAAEAAIKEVRALADLNQKLEAGRTLDQAARQARALAEEEGWDRSEDPVRAVARAREWPSLQQDINDLERDVREAKMPEETARAAAEARNQRATHEANDELTRRNERMERERSVAPQLGKVADQLEQARQTAEPARAAAREEVAKLAPTLAERLAEARDRTEAQRQETQAAASQADPEARRAAALDRLRDQQDLNRTLEAVRADLRHDAAAQDPASEAGRERARDADDGLAMLREPPPRAEDLLQRAAAAEAADQKPALEQAAAQQTALENALGMLAYHYEHLEKDDESTGMRRMLRQQEQQLGLTPELDKAYAEAGKLAALQQHPDAVALERELAANPAMQRALDRLSREALREAQSDLDQAAAGEQQLGEQADRLAAEREAKAAQLQERAAGVAKRAGELKRDRVTPAAGKADQSSPQAAPELHQAEAQLAKAERGAPAQAAANPAGAAQQASAMSESLQQAAGQLEAAGRDSEQAAQSGGSPERQNAQREVAGQAREAAGQANELAKEAARIAAELAQLPQREVEGLRAGARQQPQLTEQVAGAAQELKVAARQQERLGRNAGPQLAQAAGRAQANAQQELPQAGQALAESASARAASPAVDRAAEQVAQRADEVRALTEQLPALAQASDPGEAAAGTESSANWLARALDQMDRAAVAASAPAPTPSGTSPASAAVARAARAQQQAMARERAEQSSSAAEGQGAPTQVAGRPGPSRAAAALAGAPEDWARLPERQAEQVREAAGERVPEEYRAMVDSYFKAVAADARQEGR